MLNWPTSNKKKKILLLVLVFPFALRFHAIQKGLQLTELNQVFQDQQMC